MTTITDELMSSTATHHNAVRVERDDEPTWVVSWLPDRLLTRNQAITAMTFAEAVNADEDQAHRLAPFLDGWAAELDLTGPDAARLAKDPA
jgi:hypothetical protein